MAHDLAPERPAAVERALRFIRNPEGDRFGDVALEVFAHQFERNAPYRRFCRSRGVHGADAVRDWTDMPPVPTAAFKDAGLTTLAGTRVFLTSGTTGGDARRGRHAPGDLSLYRASWEEPFRRHLLPDRPSIRMLCLVPSPAASPESSLGFMMGEAVDRFGAPGSGFFLEPGRVRIEALERAVAEAAAAGEPVLVAGTAHALTVWMEARGPGAALPEGSRVMDTGGMKGRGPDRPREDTVARLAASFALPETHVVGEYGMTELCSQFYEPVLVVGGNLVGAPGAERELVGPPWARIRILDPDTLRPLPAGRPGLLAVWDLANAWTVSAVVTEDLAVAMPGGGFRLLGRATGAELRGCSLATEELLHG